MKATFSPIERNPFAAGRSFGEVGAYERLDGTLHFAVDPEHPSNEAIVDLRLAQRDGEGLVRFSSDVVLLQPSRLERGSGRVLVEAVNRGRRLTPWVINRSDPPQPGDPRIPEGDGFLFRHGYSVVYLGWQWDVFRDAAMMGLEAPRARIGDKDVRGRTVVEIRPNVHERTRLLANRLHRPLPVFDLGEKSAILTVRAWEDDEPRLIPRDGWSFSRETEAGDVPSREHITLHSGFEPGLQYHVIYTAAEAPITGCGLLALREVASWLRGQDPSNPLAGNVRRVYAFGMSQSGRLLRHFVFAGLNRTTDGEMAYDGLIPHVAGGRRGEFNHRFAQPSVQLTPSHGHQFPFADDVLDDPVGGGRGGLLARQTELGALPKILSINTSAEYWRGDASLIHTDPSGREDLQLPDGVRVYAIASTQHGPGSLPQVDLNPNDCGRGRYGFNTIDFTPVVRAAVLHLDDWVERGIEPPPSSVPRLADGTAVPRSDVLARFQGLPPVHLPDPTRLPVLRTVDLGPDAERGITRHPIEEGAEYPALVSAVDADGNETAGIRLPDVMVPLGTHTGWNPRHPASGGADQIMPMQGFSWFFTRTVEERAAVGDSRRSIAERYADRAAYLTQVRTAADELVTTGYVLAEDRDLLVDEAARRWDHVTSGAPDPVGPTHRK